MTFNSGTFGMERQLIIGWNVICCPTTSNYCYTSRLSSTYTDVSKCSA
jgi:hypothetical protein